MSVFSLFPALTRWLIGSWVAVGAGVALSISYILFAPEPSTMMPSVQVPDEMDDDAAKSQVVDGLDFVQRPLFAESRRPQQKAIFAEPTASTETQALADMDGLKLLGVFGSGDRQGAILQDENEKRFRMVVGEKNEMGWVLKSVLPRRALFANGSDSSLRAELTLEVAAVTGLPVTPVAAKDAPATVTDEPNREMTFDAIAKRRAEKKRKEVEDQ